MSDPRASNPSGSADDTLLGPATAEVRQSARIAGLKDFETPTLEQVERRRYELIGVVFAIIVVLTAGLAILSIPDMVELPGWLGELGTAGTLVRVLVVVLAAAFGLYIWEKERHLGKLSRSLVNERVLSAALSNRLKEISSLSEAGKAVVSSLELEDVLDIILNAAFDLLEADEGSVMLVEAEELVVAAGTGHAEAYVSSRHPLTEGLSGYVARNREPLVIEGRPSRTEFGEDLPERERSVLSAISVPLEAKGELLGVLNLNVVDGSRQSDPFNEYDLRALSLFGEHAAMAIRHARALRKERDLRTRVAELDRIRAELVGSMTHDLKTPLTTILGSAKLLLRHAERVDAERRTEILGSIEHQAERLLQLIERLLDAARAQSSYPLTSGPLELVSHVEPIVLAYGSAHERRIVLEREHDRVQAFGDPDALEQIVANLLDNAVKYTTPEATIWVRLAQRGSLAEVNIADDGPGIPLEEQGDLFEAFRRGGAGRGAGVGLGLFIVANLVHAMQGDVWVRSEPPHGATFTFTLPTEAPEPDGENEAAGAVREAEEP